jgi:hypothetical protein
LFQAGQGGGAGKQGNRKKRGYVVHGGFRALRYLTLSGDVNMEYGNGCFAVGST